MAKSVVGSLMGLVLWWVGAFVGCVLAGFIGKLLWTGFMLGWNALPSIL